MMNRKQQECRSESELASPRGALLRRGRIVALASVLSVAPMITGFPQIAPQAEAQPVDSQLREVGFVKASVASMRAAKDASPSQLSTPGAKDPIATARSGAVAPSQPVAGEVTVVGVTWPKGAVTAGDQYQIRTLTGSTWSVWKSLNGVQADGPDPDESATAKAASGDVGTSPYIVTGASRYQVRSLSTDASVPAAAKVQVVDPGTSAADTIQQSPGAAAAATAKPTIYSRASWGANEGLRRAAPSYGRVQLAFVHHTDSSNTYSADSVPAMIRGMYSYHVQSLGWNDIGYNFLVDRFGRTWEGRYGGVTRSVIGAQTANYNAVSTGVSAIGNFQNSAVPAVMTTAFTRILAWKLSVHGVPATGGVVANGKWFQRISGHRDGFPTACPGQYLYAKLAAIRAAAAAVPSVEPPANRLPIGAFDTATSKTPGVIAVSGWALDQDTTSPINVHVYVDGVATRSITANTVRLDVGRIFGKGDNHGFATSLKATAGPHKVCVYAINIPAGPNRAIACKNVVVSNLAPRGAFDSVTSAGDSFTVRGWALDPNTTSPINVHVYVDGVATRSIIANTLRPDVLRIFGKGANHGFVSSLKAAAGPHQVCVYAIDSWGGPNPRIACKNVTVNG